MRRKKKKVEERKRSRRGAQEAREEERRAQERARRGEQCAGGARGAEEVQLDDGMCAIACEQLRFLTEKMSQGPTEEDRRCIPGDIENVRKVLAVVEEKVKGRGCAARGRVARRFEETGGENATVERRRARTKAA